jgi:hypothetical protein
MATDYEKRQAEWAKREQVKEDEERKGEIEIGVITGKVTGDISKTGDTRVRIDHVETLRLKPAVDIKKGDSIKVTVKADWSIRGKKEQRWGRERDVQSGEALGKVTGNINKADELKVRIDNVETLKFKSSADLKKDDNIRVTVEKI